MRVIAEKDQGEVVVATRHVENPQWCGGICGGGAWGSGAVIDGVESRDMYQRGQPGSLTVSVLELTYSSATLQSLRVCSRARIP